MYLGASEFSITSAMNNLGRCRACLEQEMICIKRDDDKVYGKMIMAMKRDEHRRHKRTSALSLFIKR